MKAEILKIAGVKSEKEFYKKYPTEEAFMKAHKKEFKKAAMGAKMVKTQLEQLTDFGNPPKAQDGRQLDMWGNPLPMVQMPLNSNVGVGQMGLNNAPSGTMTLEGNTDLANQTQLYGTGQTISNAGALGGITPGSIQGMGSQMIGKSNTNLLGKLGGYAGIAQTAGQLIGGFQKLKEEKKQRKSAETWANVSDITKQAQESRPKDPLRHNFLRPEDQIVQPNQLFPTYGVGTNYLAKDGTRVMKIGGNLTEIQNTYAPNNLYDNLGYEPLNDSSQVKQFAGGGALGDFANQGGFNMLDTIGDAAIANNAGGDIGGAIGGTAGMVIGGPVGQAIGKTLGKTVGKLVDRNPQKMKIAQEKTKKNVGAMAFNEGAQYLQQGQYGNYMEDGGWVSHDWQPQVITQFGEHSMQDLLRRDPQMDTLRTGGHITQNNMFPTDQYALGGELKTTWGGYAEPISYNPHMPGTGETVMFRGIKKKTSDGKTKTIGAHSQSDGRGHTGIGVKYGEGGKMTDYAEFGSRDADADVEVERGEPATEMVDGQTGEKNMVVFGNLKIPNMFLNEIGDVKAKGKKFKNYVADLGKMEAKQNKIVDKSSEQIDGLNVYTPFDKLKFNGLTANVIGGNMNLKEAALKKSNAAAVQNAINDTAAEHGLDADHLAKGKVKVDPKAKKEQAKYGKELFKAQDGYISQTVKKAIIYKSARAKGYDETTARQMAGLPIQEDLSVELPETVEAETTNTTSKKRSPKSGQTKSSGYVSKYGIDPWKGNITGLGKKTASSFTAEEWDDIADKLGFKGRGNEEFEKFLLDNPKAKDIIEKRHQDLYGKAPWLDPKHFGYGWAAPELKSIGNNQEYEGEIPLVDISQIDKEPSSDDNTETSNIETVKPNKRKTWIDAANTLIPYLRPTDQEAFDYSQIAPELMSLATNQLDPVQAQLYHPDLGTPYDISLQDQMNANQADYNATQRAMGYNPAALSALAAQKYAANSNVLGQQFRLNQAEKDKVYEGNRAVLNDAQLKNLGILDTQMTRQSQAKSLTKQQNIEAMKSIASKIAQNKLENRQLGIYENLYNYRFDKSGRAVNMNPLAQFDYSGSMASSKTGGLASGLEFTYDANGNIVGTRKTKEEAKYGTKLKKESRNGSIVKAIKNL
jgi:hypothetical protein